MRLKTLGNTYIPKNLEQRIADRDKFSGAVREKYRSANTIEKSIHVTIMNMMIEVKQFRLERIVDGNYIDNLIRKQRKQDKYPLIQLIV